MNTETIKRIDIIAKNLSSLADQIQSMPGEKDVTASLPIIAATLKMQSQNLIQIYQELSQPDKESL